MATQEVINEMVDRGNEAMGRGTVLKNYENSYRAMWEEIRRARAERDAAVAMADAARDLKIAIEHDIGSGTKVSGAVHNALLRCDGFRKSS